MVVGEFAIPLRRLKEFNERIAELSKRSVRLRGKPLLSHVVRSEIRSYDIVRKRFVEGKWQNVELRLQLPTEIVHLEIDTPVIPGYSLVGYANLKNNHGPDRMAAVAGPGHTVEEVRARVFECTDAKGAVTCAHCNSPRNRKLAFVLAADADGTTGVYGSDCVQDFTGVDAEAIVRGYERLLGAAGELREAERESYSIVEWDWESQNAALADQRELRLVSLPHLLRAAIAVIDGDGGYISDSVLEKRGLPTVPARAVAIARSSDAAGLPDPNGLAEAFTGWVPRMGYRQDDLWRLKRDLSDASRNGWRIEPGKVELVIKGLLACSSELALPITGGFAAAPGERLDITATVGVTDHWDRSISVNGRDITERSTEAWLTGPGGERYLRARRFRLTGESAREAAPLEGCKGQTWELRGTVKANEVDGRGRAVCVLERVKLGARLDIGAGPKVGPVR